jgi:hypothetical protein
MAYDEALSKAHAEINLLKAEIERLTCERDAQAEDATRHFDRANGVAIENKALRAELKKLRALLSEARDDIRCEVENHYPPEFRRHSAVMRRYQRDMDLVHRIESALAPETKP